VTLPYSRSIIVACFVAFAWCMSALDCGAQGFDWKPSVTLAVTSFADTASTYFNVEHDTCSGEITPRYWTDGDYTRPNYRRMVLDNALAVGLLAGLQALSSRERARHPESRSRRLVDRIAKGFIYTAAARRGAATMRNVTLACQP
jgi:hypothetical protein